MFEDFSDILKYKEIGQYQIQGFYDNEIFFDCIYEPTYNLCNFTLIGQVREILFFIAYVNARVFAKKQKWQIIRTITNISELDANFYEINEFLSKSYIPKMVKEGLKYTAIASLDMENLSHLSTIYTLNKEIRIEIEDQIITNKAFNDYFEAYQWIVNESR
ncbi:MAG: hypothetical protein EAZ85_03595 [Bacteroidetes bacterium]|nr:MAG: hypothetical protein EAZ85_03595 [Bacteroidota bacterium]